MFKSFRSFAALAASLVALAVALPAQADFPKDLVERHPCLKEVAQPWSNPLPASKMPAAFQDWDVVYVGRWQGMNGDSDFCTALVLAKVSDDGANVTAVYTNASPYKREHQMYGRFMTVDGKKALRIEKPGMWIQYVMNDDGSLAMTSWVAGAKGALYPANKSDKVSTIK